MNGTWTAPGRVNLIGEHTDYNGGYSLPIALPHKVSCTLTTRDDSAVRVASRQHGAAWVTTDVHRLADAQVGGWARYPLGVVHEFTQRGQSLPGMDLFLDGDVPVGAGLSSSAAVECSVAVAIRDTFAPGVTDGELIDITHRAENDYVGAPTGLLDQSASILCTAGHALFLDAATGKHAQVPFDVRAAGLELVVIDTNTPHSHATGEYAARRRQCESAATQLGVPTLRSITDPARVDTLRDPVLRARARHVITENARVLQVVAALRSGDDPRAIGPILSRGHASLRDDFEVSTQELDVAVETACAAGAYGARMTGGGFGGSIVALADTGSAAHIGDAVARRFVEEGWAPPRGFVAVPSDGAGRVR